MIASEKKKGAVCPKCEETIHKHGVVINGKFYHEGCGESVRIKTASNVINKLKKIFIANG